MMAFGWELGVDGKWRMETKDDLRLKANPGTKEWRDSFYIRKSMVLQGMPY